MKVRCPHCDAQLNIRDDLRGKRGRCPRCRKDFRLEPELSGSEGLALDPWAGSHADGSSSDEFGDVEPLRLLAASRPRTKKESESEGTENAVDDEAEAAPKRRRRIRRSTWGMLAGVVAKPFWRSALSHLPYLAAALACVGALLGFLVGLVHSNVVAGLLFQMIGFPAALMVFFTMCYPSSRFLEGRGRLRGQ